MRWNEHVKLVATTLNVVALGILAVVVIQPNFAGPSGGGGIETVFGLYSTEIEGTISALVLHVLAHGMLRLLREDG